MSNDLLARLEARRDALGGRGTEQMKASLQGLIDDVKARLEPKGKAKTARAGGRAKGTSRDSR